jgi:hypothetical protein
MQLRSRGGVPVICPPIPVDGNLTHRTSSKTEVFEQVYYKNSSTAETRVIP